MYSNKSLLKLTFEIGHLNGLSMSLRFNNDQQYDQFDDKIFYYTTSIHFPTTIVIDVFNKGPQDTVVDQTGNIIADKYIKLIGIELDGVSADNYYLNEKIVLVKSNNEIVNSSYWGFNGTVTLNFNETNSFYWILHSFNQTNNQLL